MKRIISVVAAISPFLFFLTTVHAQESGRMLKIAERRRANMSGKTTKGTR